MSHDSLPVVPFAWARDQYALLDFGAGRKLEKFGPRVFDRVCPAADNLRKQEPDLWRQAQVKLDDRGKPVLRSRSPAETWQVSCGTVTFELKLTPFGHVGLFPEQVENWQWMSDWVVRRRQTQQAVSAINLFAYTGGTTLALAASGASVIHVDSSSPAVRWARLNAATSKLDDRPIRWIVEDALKFMQREAKRGNRHDLIALDPPSYGHGPKGQKWDLEQDLPELLEACAEVLAPDGRVLLTAHSASPGMLELSQWYEDYFARSPELGRLELRTVRGRKLDAGFYCR